MKKISITLFYLLLACFVQAQIVEFPYSEGFDDNLFPPEGWDSYPLVSGDMEFVRVTAGEWPECLPHDGSTAMAQYNSFNASAGEEAVLITPELMLDDDNVVRFWFFRSQDPSNNRRDKIEVYYNSSPELTGATFLDSVNRAVNFYPEVAFEDWYQYEFSFNHPGSTYIIFKAKSAYGWKMYLDDIEINTSTIDTDPPEVISLEGTQVYAQQEMELLLRVRDDSGMPETLQGEATIEGTTVAVVMTKINAGRGDYLYSGTIAGQPDHTEGVISFYLVDEVGNDAMSDFYTIRWDWVRPIFEEGFEGEAFPPEGWTRTGEPLTWLTWDDYGYLNYIDSDGAEWDVYPPEGERQAAVEWDFQGNDQDEWLISPEISIAENAALTFKTFCRLYSYDYDEYRVEVSTDGFTWNTIWSADDYEPGVTNYDEEISLSLNEFLGQDIRIAWHAYNLMGTNLWYSWFIDEVKVRATDTLVGVSEIPARAVASLSPNPFHQQAKLSFELDKPGTTMLTVFTMSGNVILEKQYEFTGTGTQTIVLSGQEIPAGFYVYELKTATRSVRGRFVKQ